MTRGALSYYNVGMILLSLLTLGCFLYYCNKGQRETEELLMIGVS